MTLIRRFEKIGDVEISPQLTVDGRRRVAQNSTLLDLKALHDNAGDIYDEVTGGGAVASTYTTDKSGYVMSTDASGEYIIRQSKNWARYVAGNNQLVEITFDNMSPESNITKRLGYFSSSTSGDYDSNFDGFYLESSGGTMKIVIAKNGSLTIIEQANWSQDKLDGTGESGQNINFNNFNVFVVDFLWLGGAGMRMGFIVGGEIIWVHIVIHANNASGVQFISPQQPIRYEIRQTGAGSGTMSAICARVATEGEASRSVGIHRSAAMGIGKVDADNTTDVYGIIGLRLKSTRRNMVIELETLSVQAVNNDDFLWKLIINPNLAGTWGGQNWTSVSSESALEFAYGNNATSPSVAAASLTGTVVSSGYVNGNDQVDANLASALKLGSTIAGVMDEMIIAIQPVTTNLDVRASLSWQEFL